MRTLARNKTTIWYATPTDKTELLDEYGNRTGQYKLTYSEPQPVAMNIRWDDGAVRLEGFGLNASARRRMVTDDMNCPIDIDSILWIGIEPDEHGTVAYNFVVAEAPQKSLTQIVYIVEEVNASREPLESN